MLPSTIRCSAILSNAIRSTVPLRKKIGCDDGAYVIPLELRPVPIAGPHTIVGISAASDFDTVELNTMSYGRSGENEKTFVTERPAASRYSKVSVPGALAVLSESALGLNNALSRTALTA